MPARRTAGPVPLARSVVRVGFDGPDADAARSICTEAGARMVLDSHDPGREDVLVVDEWTAETDPHVTSARARGVRVTVLAELLLERVVCPVVAVTGTAGKSTTCHMVAHLLRAAGVTPVMSSTARSGNAWPDHSVAAAQCNPTQVLVAELTSTHLCHMDGPPGPRVAVVTAIWPDHLELHGGYGQYLRAKRRLLTGQRGDDAAVLPADDPATRRAIGDPQGATWEFSEFGPVGRGAFSADGRVVLRGEGDEVDAGPMPGLFPPARRALLAAATACLALGLEPEAVTRGLATPPEIAHRMCRAGIIGGVTIVDNSMAATPTKAHAGVAALQAVQPVVILGGHDALGDQRVHESPEERERLSRALRDVRRMASAVVAMGSARCRIEDEISVEASVDGIEAALIAAVGLARPGGTVLVSPMFPMLPDERRAVAEYAGSENPCRNGPRSACRENPARHGRREGVIPTGIAPTEDTASR